ncbi:MAG: hypothetical protein WKF94_18170 [Solirubrobacteraceae bacterium]
MTRTLLATLLLLLAVPSLASAATLTTDRPCYIPGQPLRATGSGWAPGSAWSVTGAGLSGSGTADGAGAFAFNTQAPTVASSTKPRTLALVGNQDGTEVARTNIKVVSFLVDPKDPSGKPTGTTSWGFSGFTPGKPIFVHVKRGKKNYTEKAGKGDKPCGTLRTRLRRLPAVPPSQVSFGKYQVFVDNRRKFTKGGLQYKATITIFRTAAN